MQLQPQVVPAAPRLWDAKSKSALRKCMFMQIPDELRALAPPPSAPLPAPAPRAQKPIADMRPRDPRKDVRAFPAYHTPVPRQLSPRHITNGDGRSRHMKWWEDPVALGSMLILLPPIGLAAVWASKRYSNDARWALTVMTALMMCLASVLTIVLVLR